MITRFTKQEAISALNKALPPSSTSIHNPGMLSDTVALTHEFMGPGWGADQLRFAEFISAAGATTIASDIVPAGKWRYIHAAHGIQLGAPAVAKSFSLVIFDGVTSLDAVVAFSADATLTLTGIAGYTGVTVQLKRPVAVPPGCGFAHNGSAVDAAAVLRLRYLFVDLDIGETPPVRL